MGPDELAGRTFGPTEPYEVTRERVAEFAAAIGASYDDGAAPPTFPIVVAFAALRALVEDPGTGLALERIVHGEQRFVHERPILPGDVLRGTLTVESVRALGDAAYIRTVTEVVDQQGALAVTAWATVIHRGSASEPDPEPGSQPSGTLPGPRSGEPR